MGVADDATVVRAASGGETQDTVAVVIPTYNARELIIECVRRLTGERCVGRVVVVDDASNDGTLEALEALRVELPMLTVVRLDAHHGLAHALNRGTLAADARLVLFLNNDVLAQEGATQRLVEALADDPEAMSAGGRLVDPGSDRTQTPYQPRALPGAAGLIARVSGIERWWPPNPWTGQHLRRPLDQTVTQRTTRQPAGACLMVRREALEAIGGWDERYWMWYEDVDISRRLLDLGPALYVPAATFEHVGAASTGGWRKHDQRERLYHGTMVYAKAHLARPAQIAVGGALLAACLPRLLLARALRAGAGPARAYARLSVNAANMCALRPLSAPRFDLDRPATR